MTEKLLSCPFCGHKPKVKKLDELPLIFCNYFLCPIRGRYMSVYEWNRRVNRSASPKTEKAKDAIVLLEKTISIISVIKPRLWYIENPRGMMRKVIVPILDRYGLKHRMVSVTYCQYGDTRMKPTDIWTNDMDWKARPMCKNGDKCHQEARRGAKTGTQGLKGAIDRAVIPPALFHEILDSKIVLSQ